MSRTKRGAYPTAFAARILLRAYSQEEMDELLERYNEAKMHDNQRYYEPTPTEIRFFFLWLAGEETPKEIAKSLGVSPQTIANHFAKIGKMVINGDIKKPKN